MSQFICYRPPEERKRIHSESSRRIARAFRQDEMSQPSGEGLSAYHGAGDAIKSSSVRVFHGAGEKADMPVFRGGGMAYHGASRGQMAGSLARAFQGAGIPSAKGKGEMMAQSIQRAMKR